MPIYGYICRNCEHTLDALQKMSDDPLVDCPECGEPALKRQLSAPRFRLKGSGWYETDFKTDKQRNLAGDKEPEKKEEKKDDAKSASGKDGTKEKPAEKPAEKPDAKSKTGAKSASKTTAA